MNIAYRSLIALSIATALIGCGDDSQPTVTFPDKPEPLIPAPAETFTTQIGDVMVTATKEELVITSNTEDDKLASVESFKGIKFANEPEHFTHSTPVKLTEVMNSEGIVDATDFGDACTQARSTDFGSELELEQSQDCLNLNIWRPVGTTEQDELPVYVFIHGGDFEYGTGANPMIHGDTVVAQGADEGNPFIMVTFNYRLGLFGTRWVKGVDVNGNYGIGDQETLLEWVNKNIYEFGGAPGNVTLMGQGSGAMSIALLQQKASNQNPEEEDIHFNRAIMQSMPYGYEFNSYNSARPLLSDGLDDAEYDEIVAKQADTLDPLNKVISWVTASALTNSNSTPMSTLMPYAPYLECSQLKEPVFGIPSTQCEEGYGQQQPVASDFVVPTVIGFNAEESNTMSMLPNLTSLIAIICDELQCFADDESELTAQRMSEWLASDDNQAKVTSRLNELAKSADLSKQLELEELVNTMSLTAYQAVTTLFYGTNNTTASQLMALRDFKPELETELVDAIGNMGKYRTIMNDTLFAGPARKKAAESKENTALYYFDYKTSFNVWGYGISNGLPDDLGDFLKSLSCVSDACGGSELPLVFNKAIRMDGTELSPDSSDKQLMNEVSRSWFNGTLFSDANQYVASQDQVLVIDADGMALSAPNWDKTHNQGIDENLSEGRLTGLEELNILLSYMPE
ncbi:carboxylesterase family protein [Vibrio sp. Makdt]|uniref:carboxylesterase family protein n=1 Tax=Vibrio sp. Makdt TaxID=2998828 RepID=UPI0022CD7213|nr:carboxylesterase family protein [Vibrio sp. Makdt]MDA0151299.1 carboxylesterase family protein [Vibrio sp. Makdt]